MKGKQEFLLVKKCIKVLLLYVYSLAFTLSPIVPIYTAAHLKNFI